jgi:hypothetical protein
MRLLCQKVIDVEDMQSLRERTWIDRLKGIKQRLIKHKKSFTLFQFAHEKNESADTQNDLNRWCKNR